MIHVAGSNTTHFRERAPELFIQSNLFLNSCVFYLHPYFPQLLSDFRFYLLLVSLEFVNTLQENTELNQNPLSPRLQS